MPATHTEIAPTSDFHIKNNPKKWYFTFTKNVQEEKKATYATQYSSSKLHTFVQEVTALIEQSLPVSEK